MRGFAITLDSVLAISFFLFAILLIMAQSYQSSAPGEVYLRQLTLDTLTVMEKTGAVGHAIEGNTSEVQRLMEALPASACIGMSVMDSAGDTVMTVVKSGCDESAGLDMQAAARPLLYQGQMYLMKSKSWLRKEPEGG